MSAWITFFIKIFWRPPEVNDVWTFHCNLPQAFPGDSTTFLNPLRPCMTMEAPQYLVYIQVYTLEPATKISPIVHNIGGHNIGFDPLNLLNPLTAYLIPYMGTGG